MMVMDANGQEWTSLAAQGSIWLQFVPKGMQWIAMDCHGLKLQWIAMDYDGPGWTRTEGS